MCTPGTPLVPPTSQSFDDGKNAGFFGWLHNLDIDLDGNIYKKYTTAKFFTGCQSLY